MDIDLQLDRAIVVVIRIQTSCLPLALPNEPRLDIYIRYYTQLIRILHSSFPFPASSCVVLVGSLPFQAMLSDKIQKSSY